MPYPAITTLPSAPSRLGDPNNFVTESLDFLEAQIDFTDECNAISTYLNTAKFDSFEWGNLSAITGSAPVSITHFINAAPSTVTLSGSVLADAIDDMLASMVAFVPDANTVGEWIDTVEDPSAPAVDDPSRPVVTTIAPGGQALSIIAGSTNYIVEDRLLRKFSNNNEGAFVRAFDRLFDMYGKGLSLPQNYLGGETIADTLIA